MAVYSYCQSILGESRNFDNIFSFISESNRNIDLMLSESVNDNDFILNEGIGSVIGKVKDTVKNLFTEFVKRVRKFTNMLIEKMYAKIAKDADLLGSYKHTNLHVLGKSYKVQGVDRMPAFGDLPKNIDVVINHYYKEVEDVAFARVDYKTLSDHMDEYESKLEDIKKELSELKTEDIYLHSEKEANDTFYVKDQQTLAAVYKYLKKDYTEKIFKNTMDGIIKFAEFEYRDIVRNSEKFDKSGSTKDPDSMSDEEKEFRDTASKYYSCIIKLYKEKLSIYNDLYTKLSEAVSYTVKVAYSLFRIILRETVTVGDHAKSAISDIKNKNK